MDIINQLASTIIGANDVAPSFKVMANGADITQKINERLISLRLTDESGNVADEVEITLSDHGAPLALPSTGAELVVSLGYDGKLVEMGMFVVDELEISGPPNIVVIRARSVVQAPHPTKTMMQTQKTRSWEKGTLLGDLVKSIAAENGLIGLVSNALAVISLSHINQNNESDMALVTRLANLYDAIAKPSGNKLVVAKVGDLKTPSNTKIPDVNYTRSDTASHRLSISRRVKSGTVIASYRDTELNKTMEVQEGSGEPVRKLVRSYANKEEAAAAAKSQLKTSQRMEGRLSLTLVGNPYLIAGGAVNVSQFREGIDGRWLINSVEHSISKSAGYATNVECTGF